MRTVTACLCVCALASLALPAPGDPNPYASIWTRNSFGLKPPPRPSAPMPPPEKPAPNLQLTGITSIPDGKRALFALQGPGGKTTYLSLAEHQREGPLEVSFIDEDKATVLVKLAGRQLLLSFESPGSVIPTDAAAVAGEYCRTDGPAYNLELTLTPAGGYSAHWSSCLTKPGDASGRWSLAGQRITFTPEKEDDSIKGRLTSLDVLRFQDDWILAPVPGPDRKYDDILFEEQGVTRRSCFQKAGQMFEPDIP